jgi:predicted RNA binding protein YcfA (HicA-like mRNA interferase family)
MPPFGPISRRALIGNLRKLGFEGPFAGGRHQFMRKEDITVFIPNPHQGDICRNLLTRILHQANVTRSDWESL